jgi:hypothetical protein
MNENPYRAPEYVNEPGQDLGSEWPWWVRLSVGKRRSRTRAYRRVGLLCFVWAVMWVTLARRQLGGTWDEWVCVIMTVWMANGLIAIAWINRHKAWPEPDVEGVTTAARKKRATDSRV